MLRPIDCEHCTAHERQVVNWRGIDYESKLVFLPTIIAVVDNQGRDSCANPTRKITGPLVSLLIQTCEGKLNATLAMRFLKLGSIEEKQDAKKLNPKLVQCVGF